MNPELLQMLAQLQRLQQLSGPMAMGFPDRIADPLRMQASNAGQMDVVSLIEQLRGTRRGPSPQMTREPQKQQGLSGWQQYNPDAIIGEVLRGANQQSQQDLNRERIRGGF